MSPVTDADYDGIVTRAKAAYDADPFDPLEYHRAMVAYHEAAGASPESLAKLGQAVARYVLVGGGKDLPEPG
jgi:hypothetical protein